MSFAEKTTVPVDRSQAEIKKILQKYGATGFAFAENPKMAIIIFEANFKRIKFVLPMPQAPSNSATQSSIKTYEQLCRTKWRCLVLAIKSKLESVTSGITTFEQEFMAHIVLPNGSTVGDTVLPEIESSYKDGNMPPLLGMRS